MSLRNARPFISKFKPSIAIMKEIPQRFPSLLQQVQITKSVWYSKTKVIFQYRSYIPRGKEYNWRQKIYSKTETIFQHESYIPRQKDSCQFKSCRNSAHAVLTLPKICFLGNFSEHPLSSSSCQRPWIYHIGGMRRRVLRKPGFFWVAYYVLSPHFSQTINTQKKVSCPTRFFRSG